MFSETRLNGCSGNKGSPDMVVVSVTGQIVVYVEYTSVSTVVVSGGPVAVT